MKCIPDTDSRSGRFSGRARCVSIEGVSRSWLFESSGYFRLTTKSLCSLSSRGGVTTAFCFDEAMAGKITALVVQEKNKERVSVFLDGEFAFGLAMIEALKLRKGQLLTDQEIERLKALDEIEVAHERALKFLSYRPRSIAEVRRSLVGKGFSPATIDAVVQRLKEANLLDDQAFARYWVDNRETFEPRSGRALRFELRKKGLADPDISAAVEGVNEEDAAYRAALPQARRYAHLDRQAFTKKVGDFLLRRGFPYSTARDIVRRLWGELGPSDGRESSQELFDIDQGE